MYNINYGALAAERKLLKVQKPYQQAYVIYVNVLNQNKGSATNKFSYTGS